MTKGTSKALRLTATLVLLFLVYRREDPAHLFGILRGMSPAILALVFALYFFNTAISAWKWQMFLNADRIHVPLPRLVASYLSGTFLNLFLPSSIGGDAYRVYDIAKQSRRTAHSFASVLAERLSGFIALVILGLGAGLIGFQRLPDHSILWIPLVAMAGLFVLTALLFQQRLVVRILGMPPLNRIAALRRLADKLFESIAEYRRAPNLFVRIMALSFVFQANAIVCIYLLSRGLGLDIPLLYFGIFVPLISLIEAIPISIFGLGIRDASYAFFFGSVGVDPTVAKSMALTYVVFTIVYSLLGGAVLLYRTLRGQALPPPDSIPQETLP